MPIPRSAPVHRMPPGARRAALLTALENAPGPTTAAELAEATGLHANTVRAHLDVLVREGRATRRTEQRVTRGRPRELYEATGAPDPAQAYASLALLLADQLAATAPDPCAEGERMGRRWATHDDAAGAPEPGPTAPGTSPTPGPGHTRDVARDLTEVLRVLRRAGFAPELADDGSEVRLHACPIREVAAAQPGVVCQAHLGLIRATLERSGSSVAARAIHPFVAPGLCVATFEGPGVPASPSGAPQ
nr:helix-turn-helix domain-containing protein [uncultured Actinotalea sp.]